MPYQGHADGLYLVKQRSAGKSGVEHYGILNIGNRLGDQPAAKPVVYHNTPPGLRADWLHDTGTWTIVGRITDEALGVARLRAAWANPSYDMLGNNCEHFALYVATGERKSPQVRSGVALVGIGIAVAVLSSRD